jgi:hypothetical protein
MDPLARRNWPDEAQFHLVLLAGWAAVFIFVIEQPLTFVVLLVLAAILGVLARWYARFANRNANPSL